MIFDIHLHTRAYSVCSNMDPEDLLYRAVEIGLDGIALTEHGIRWPDHKVETLLSKTKTSNLVIIVGQEVACFENGRKQGHFLAFGVKESLGSNISAQQLIQRVHGEGGVVIPAHPYKKSRIGDGYYGLGDGVFDFDVDAIELYHPDQDQEAWLRIREASKKLNLPLTGGSDAHELSAVGACTTLFEDEIREESHFIEAIRTGKITPQRGRSQD